MIAAWVLILAIAQPSYDGGAALHSVPFATYEACRAAQDFWNGVAVYDNRGNSRGKVLATCHGTGAK